MHTHDFFLAFSSHTHAHTHTHAQSTHSSTQTLWFGRDVLGRRSLLWHHPAVSDNVFALSSVACCSAGTPLVSTLATRK